MDDSGRGSREQLRRELERLAPSIEDIDLSAGFLRSVMAHVPAMVSAVEPDGRFLYVNQTIPGLTAADVLGKTIYDFMPPDTHDAARETLARVMQTGEPDDYIGYGPGQMGPRSRYQNWVQPIRSGDEVIALTLITLDVSKEWEVQRQLTDREKRLSLALRAAGMGMYRWDARAAKVEMDERAREIYGIEETILTREQINRHIHPDDREELTAAARDAMMKGEPYYRENRIVRSDGSVRWISGHGLPLYGEDEQLSGMLGTLVDITDRRQLEEQLREAQKLEAVGQLTAGIAHNFNNMLASILPTLEIIKSNVDEEDAALITSALEAGNRAALMVRELLTFAGRNRPKARRTESPQALVERTLSICRTTFERGIALELDVAEELPTVAVDAAQIEQALLNILLNARSALRDAATSSPRVAVRLDVVTHDEEPALPSESASWVRIRVEDNGAGMDEETRKRIFEPFFTTKDVGEGTGLGLSTTYAIIVREHGGVVRCESEVGRGATFTILLPSGAAANTTTEPVATAVAPKTHGVVLVVDDERVVRTVLTRILKDAGYAVHGASDGAEALRMLSEVEPNVVLLDLNMPGRPYREVIADIRRAGPDLKIVVYTGQVLDDALEGVDAVLRKPAEAEAIARAIGDALGR